MVRCGHCVVRRTCGSVRSSLSARARLVTVGSEAAETTSLHRRDEEIFREENSATASVNVVGGTGWMVCPTQVNCQGIVSSKEPKTLRGSGQNRQRSRLFYPIFGTHG